MSNIHEESLLSESMSLEDLHDADDGSLSTHPDEHAHKFGIVNTNDLAKDANASGDDCDKLDKEVLSYCNSYLSNADTLKSTQNQSLNTSYLEPTQTASDSYYYHSSSSCSGIEDTKEQSFGLSSSRLDNASLLTTSSDSVQKSSHILSSSMSKNWVVFDHDDDHETHLERNMSDSFSKKPPDIPRRKGLPSTSKPPTAPEALNKSLEHIVPPIPSRLLTPQKPPSPLTLNNEIRIPPPPMVSNNSLKRQSRSRSSVSTPLSQLHPDSVKSPTLFAFGPPVPPRRDILQRQSERDSVSDLSRASETSSLQGWFRFDKAGSSQDELLESGSLCTNRTTPSQLLTGDDIRSSISSLNAESSMVDTGSIHKDADAEDSSKWISPSSPESLKSNKKKKKGYQHLSSGSEEEADIDNKSVLDGNEITIEVTDLSPAKPLGRWTIMKNEAEDKSGSSGDISARNSMLDPHDELDLDDAFALGDDRLSTDGNGLKGFNRADRGSQNNLVDFSESAEQLDNSACEEDGSSENELETVFDMTAQGDSLKRRRKKKADRDSASPRVIQSTSSAISSAKQLLDASTLDSSAEAKPTNISTNPFYRHSPVGDTISLTSSTSESNPFDRVQFQTVALPSNTSTPMAKASKTSNIPTLPPPPKSNKARTLSSSLSRPRPLNDTAPVALSFAPLEEHKRTSSISSSVQESKLESSVDTPLKSDSVSLLDLAEDESFTDGTATTNEPAMTSLLRQDDDVKVSKVSNEESAGTSRKDSSIFETALQILDASSKSPPVNLNNPNLHAHPVLTEFPALSQSSLSPLEDLLKKPISDNPVRSVTDLKELKLLKRDNLISSKTAWEMLMRFPREKHPMSSRKWVPVYVKLNTEKIQNPTLQLLHNSSSETPFYFIPLSSHEFQLSNPTLRPRFNSTKRARKGIISSEGLNPDAWQPEMREVAYYNAIKRKLHCIKVFQIHYKEKRAFSTKKDKYMTRVPSGFKHSVKKKQAVKLGTENYADLLSFVLAISDISFNANRFRKGESSEEHHTTVKYHSKDEIMFEVQDEFLGEVTSEGVIEACDVIVHVFVTSFLTGDPLATVTFNNKKVKGKEVVRRSDIIPVSNNNWIEMTDIEVHRCSPRGFEEETAAITFHPPDACRFELVRFHCPCADKEPPLVVRPTVTIQGHRVTLRCAIRTSSRLSNVEDPLFQVPCDNVSIRFSIPDSWVPAFRKVAKGGYKSIHASRVIKPSPGREKVLGGVKIVRCHAAIEASVGSGKYEVAYNALVWRIKRVPEKNAVSNTPQVFMCVIELESEHLTQELDFSEFRTCAVEYTMPWCTASDACIRSVALPNCSKAEKFTTYSSHYLYRVQIALSRDGNETSDCAVQ